MLPGLIAGHYTFKDGHIDLEKFCRWADVHFIYSKIQQIDPVAKKSIPMGTHLCITICCLLISVLSLALDHI